MNQLFSLLILIIGIIVIVSSSTDNNNNNNNQQQQQQQQHKIRGIDLIKQQKYNCFTSGSTDFIGYSTSYELISHNAYQSQNGTIKPTSFFEYGYMDLDYKNQLLYISYEINRDSNPLKGRVWLFGANSTQYFIPKSNGSTEEVCYYTAPMMEVPTQTYLKYIGDYSIGSTDCEVFLLNNTASHYLYEQLLVNNNDCSLTTLMSRNLIKNTTTTVGNSLMNFYQFEPQANPANFQLPSICYNLTPTPTTTPTTSPSPTPTPTSTSSPTPTPTATSQSDNNIQVDNDNIYDSLPNSLYHLF